MVKIPSDQYMEGEESNGGQDLEQERLTFKKRMWWGILRFNGILNDLFLNY